MEVLAAVAASVGGVLLLADKASKHLEVREVKESVVELNKMLSMLKSYFSYYDKDQDGQKGQGCGDLTENFAKQIRDLTFEIEDALDEFMLKVPLHFHTANLLSICTTVLISTRARTPPMSYPLRGKNSGADKELSRFVPILNSATLVSVKGYFSIVRSHEGDEMVGFEKRQKEIFKQQNSHVLSCKA